MTDEEPVYKDEDLWELILTLEEGMCAEGITPKERHFKLPIKAMERLGFKSFVLSGSREDPLLKRIRALHATLYRPKDVAVGGLHGGAFMFNGIAAQVYVPIIYGAVMIDPFEFCDLSPSQIEWLRSSPAQDRAYLVNFCNLFDFSACLHPMGDYGEVSKAALPLLQLAAFQTQSAGAALCAAFDNRGAVQSALVAAELSMKAALAGAGSKESELKVLGHDFVKLAEAVGDAYEKFELRPVKELARGLPELVPNRYSPKQPERNETGSIVMSSQAIAGAVARVLTEGSLLSLIEASAA